MNYNNYPDTREHRLVFQFGELFDKARDAAGGAVGKAGELGEELIGKGEEAFDKTKDQLIKLKDTISEIPVDEFIEDIKKDIKAGVEPGEEKMKQIWQRLEEGKLPKALEKELIKLLRIIIKQHEPTAEKIYKANLAHRAMNGEEEALDILYRIQLRDMPKHTASLYHPLMSPLLTAHDAYKNRERIWWRYAKHFDQEGMIKEIKKEYDKQIQEVADKYKKYGVTREIVEKIVLDPDSEYYPYK